MARIRADFVQGTLSGGPYSTTDTSFTSAGFSSLPVVNSPDTATLVFDPMGAYGVPEKVSVTAHASGSGTVTVERGTDGTQTGLATRSHNVSGALESWILGATSQDFAELESEIATISGSNFVLSGVSGHLLPTAAGSLPTPSGTAGAPTSTIKFLLQTGSNVVTLNSSSQASLTFPVPFPTGILTIVPNIGDDSIGGLTVSPIEADVTLSGFSISVSQGTTAGYTATGGGPIRINYLAVGW